MREKRQGYHSFLLWIPLDVFSEAGVRSREENVSISEYIRVAVVELNARMASGEKLDIPAERKSP